MSQESLRRTQFSYFSCLKFLGATLWGLIIWLTSCIIFVNFQKNAKGSLFDLRILLQQSRINLAIEYQFSKNPKMTKKILREKFQWYSKIEDNQDQNYWFCGDLDRIYTLLRTFWNIWNRKGVALSQILSSKL